MKPLKCISLLLCFLLCLLACKDKTPKLDSTLASIDFQRGELLWCGDGQFGELKFSLSCSYETRATLDLCHGVGQEKNSALEMPAILAHLLKLLSLRCHKVF